ncbi:MAG: hypothetical protein AB1397_00035 [bacterium]
MAVSEVAISVAAAVIVLCFLSWPVAASGDKTSSKLAVGPDGTVSYKEQILQHATDDIGEIKGMEQHVKELETEKAIREEAIRSIIRDAISTLGSNINESMALGGTLEMVGGRTKDFSHQSEGVLLLNTAELNFEIQINKWTSGSFVIKYDDGSNISFPTTKGFEAGVDRINLDTAFFTIGDPQRFPPFLTFGKQIILPFGISTGDPVAGVLTIENPLTVNAFEMKDTAIGFGLGFPTPALTPATPPITLPPVRPLVINPLISSLMRGLGYRPPPMRPPPLTFITPTPNPPLFNVGFYSYDGSTFERVKSGGYKPSDHINATVGFLRTKGNCGRRYDQLRGSAFCPWSIDVDVDYISSVFDSQFLRTEYRSFLDQIGFVPGMAVSVKAILGPRSFIGEWNGAMRGVTFIDGLNNRVSIKPSAWQITLSHQFDWNPWVEVIGAQGNYLTISYSQTYNLAGVFNNESSRVGFLPKRRFIVNIGEWVLEGLKFAVEYSHNVDYSKNEGGTGNSGNTIFLSLTTVW